jgi:hypothetical protein
MSSAWGIQKLAQVEKIGDYIFKIEFASVEEKQRIVERGPWRHEGDALILAHYDSLMCPSKIRILTIGLWVCPYDLPSTMMKQSLAMPLGGQLGKVMKSDVRYPSYMWIRVEWPLTNPLKPELVDDQRKGAYQDHAAVQKCPTLLFHVWQDRACDHEL